jgi:hypothetical protein
MRKWLYNRIPLLSHLLLFIAIVNMLQTLLFRLIYLRWVEFIYKDMLMWNRSPFDTWFMYLFYVIFGKNFSTDSVYFHFAGYNLEVSYRHVSVIVDLHVICHVQF